jgi:hypothetical protein
LEDSRGGLGWRGVIDDAKIMDPGGPKQCLLGGHTLQDLLADSAVFRMGRWVEWIVWPPGKAFFENVEGSDQQSYPDSARSLGRRAGEPNIGSLWLNYQQAGALHLVVAAHVDSLRRLPGLARDRHRPVTDESPAG